MLMISKIRKENCITQAQLAEASGLNIRWIQKVESGEINIENISLKNIFCLLKGLENLCPPSQRLSEDFTTIRSAYIVVRELLK